MRDIIIKSFPHILHGGDYNPEQWLDRPYILSEDMRLMQAANCNEMTVGIFSWSILEPEEGKFDFSFLDKTIDDVYKAGGRIILATPSGARPVWMAEKYPQVLRMNHHGHREHFGGRHNHCYSSPIYREKTAIINRKLAERYGSHPAVAAWHISNEYGGECFCPICVAEFRKWLERKYKTIDNLNQQWWTAFWSHKYFDWSQIEPPMPLNDYTVHGRNLDWKRFVSFKTAEFLREEIKAVREYSKDIPVTTNLMGFYDGLDYRLIADEIDFVSYDSYPVFGKGAEEDIKEAVYASMSYDLNRGLKNRPFLLMESCPSSLNWHPVNKLKRPGINELLSLQSVAHGSDSVLYFQWRKGRGESEKFHGAVVDHSGSENTRVFKEIAQLGKRLKLLDSVVGAVTEAQAAVLFDWDNRWALEDAVGYCNTDKKYKATLQNYYTPFWKRGINVDIIGRDSDFSKYKLLVAPMLYMVDEALEKKLCDYAENGGTILAALFTGTVNENDLCHLGGIPCGRLKELFGIYNEETDSLYPYDSNTVLMNDGKQFKALDYCEIIHTVTAEAIGHYSKDFYKGFPALTVNSYGKGRAYYAAFRDEGEFSDYIIEKIIHQVGIDSCFDGEIPYGVTAHSRTDGEKNFVFLQNFTDKSVSLKTEKHWFTVESLSEISDIIKLSPYETVILSDVE